LSRWRRRNVVSRFEPGGRPIRPTSKPQVAASGPGSVGKVGFPTEFLFIGDLAVDLAVTAQARTLPVIRGCPPRRHHGVVQAEQH
jgi:hypothetical protein